MDETLHATTKIINHHRQDDDDDDEHEHGGPPSVIGPTTITTNNSNDSDSQQQNQQPSSSRSRFNPLLHLPFDNQGGNVSERCDTAIRAAVGSFTVFSALVLSHQQYFSSIWIGNIFMIVALQANLGATIKSAYGFGRSILGTTLLSWPVAYMINEEILFDGYTWYWLFPPLVFLLSLLLFSIPNVTSPNLMVLVMYVNVGYPVRQRMNTDWWQPLGSMGSYFVGLAVSVLMHMVLPCWKWNTAARHASSCIHQLNMDMTLFLKETYAYTKTTGVDSTQSRVAGAGMQLATQRISKGTNQLKTLLPDIKTEEAIFGRWSSCCGCSSCLSTVGDSQKLEQWVNRLESSVQHVNTLTMTLNQRYMGETVETTKEATKELRQNIYRHVQEYGYGDMIDSMIETFEICNNLADPLSSSKNMSKSGDPHDMENPNSTVSSNSMTWDATVQKLKRTIASTKHGFSIAISTATKEVQQTASMPVFAHIARRLTSFHSLTMLGQDLIQYYESNIASQQQDHTNEEGEDKGMMCKPRIGISRWCASLIHASKTPWLLREAERRRLALKTSVGMFLASLFISVGALWDISEVRTFQNQKFVMLRLETYPANYVLFLVAFWYMAWSDDC